MVSIEEIDNRIAELHHKGKGTREISADVHKNFSYVGARLKILFPEEYSDNCNDTITKETQALKLFSLRKTPTQAAIELNETPDSIEKYFMDYWRLQRINPCIIFTEKIKRLFPIYCASITYSRRRIFGLICTRMLQSLLSSKCIEQMTRH